MQLVWGQLEKYCAKPKIAHGMSPADHRLIKIAPDDANWAVSVHALPIPSTGDIPSSYTAPSGEIPSIKFILDSFQLQRKQILFFPPDQCI